MIACCNLVLSTSTPSWFKVFCVMNSGWSGWQLRIGVDCHPFSIRTSTHTATSISTWIAALSWKRFDSACSRSAEYGGFPHSVTGEPCQHSSRERKVRKLGTEKKVRQANVRMSFRTKIAGWKLATHESQPLTNLSTCNLMRWKLLVAKNCSMMSQVVQIRLDLV